MNKFLILPFALLLSFVVLPVLAIGGATDLAKGAFYAIEENPFDGDNLRRAVDDIRRAQELNPDKPWVAIAISRVHLEVAYRAGNRHLSGSYDLEGIERAQRFAERGVLLGPQESLAHSQLARIQIITGNDRAAWQTLNAAYKHDHNDFYPWYLRSVIAVRMKDPTRAHTAFHEAEKRATRLYQRRILLQEQINLARQTKDLEERDRLYRAVIDLDPNNPHAHGNYGAFLLGQRRYDEAIKHLEKAVEISPYPLAEKQLRRARKRGN